MKSIIMKSVLAVVSILLSASASFADRLYIDSFDIRAGETKDIAVCLSSSQAITALQAEMYLSPGMEIVKHGEEWMTLSERASSDHNLIVNTSGFEIAKIVCFSNTNAVFSGTEGALINLRIKASEDFTGGYISLVNIKLSDGSDHDIILDNTDCYVTGIVAVESVQLSQEYAELRVGEGFLLEAYIFPDNATDKTVIWSSDNEAVAYVDSNGFVTANSIGSAVVTATCGNMSATCVVTVVATPVDSVTLSNTEAQLKVGESFALTAFVYPEDATDRTVVWASDNEAVATVDENGTVTAVSLGTAVITASCGVYTAPCVVTVVATPVESVTLSQNEAELKVGEWLSLSAEVYPIEATDRTVVWTSDNEAVATVDENGTVTAVSMGWTVINASCGGYTASCVVTVVATPVEGIVLSQNEAQLKVGEGLSLSTEVYPMEATDRTVVWASDNEAVATVDENGNVVAVSLGSAVITASCGGYAASCVVTVVATPVESIVLSHNEAQLKAGEWLSLSAEVYPIDATDRTVVWTSDNDAVATVDENGTVTAISVGWTVINASCGDCTAHCVVTVEATMVERILLSPDSWNGIEGESFKIEATVVPENATEKALVWASSDESVATVDSEGTVSVLKEGTCVITATAADGSGVSAECMVTSVSGVECIFPADENLDVYDIKGIAVKKNTDREGLKLLTPGIYLIRQGNEMKKIIIR